MFIRLGRSELKLDKVSFVQLHFTDISLSLNFLVERVEGCNECTWHNFRDFHTLGISEAHLGWVL